MPVKITQDSTAAVDAFFDWAEKQDLLIGIPEEKAERGDGITNAVIGYISEYGAPEANIPARPWLMPGVEAAQGEVVDEAARGADRAIGRALAGDLSGAKDETEQAFHRIGLKVTNKIRGRITAGISPPLSPRTIYARMHRKKNRRSGGDMKPLIDTAQFIRSISYVIRQRG